MAATSDPEGLVSWKKVIEGEPSDVVPLDPLTSSSYELRPNVLGSRAEDAGERGSVHDIR